MLPTNPVPVFRPEQLPQLAQLAATFYDQMAGDEQLVRHLKDVVTDYLMHCPRTGMSYPAAAVDGLIEVAVFVAAIGQLLNAE